MPRLSMEGLRLLNERVPTPATPGKEDAPHSAIEIAKENGGFSATRTTVGKKSPLRGLNGSCFSKHVGLNEARDGSQEVAVPVEW